MFVLDQQNVSGHLRRHVRVAVAVAADPGAERQRAAVRRRRHTKFLQRIGKIREDLWCRIGVKITKVVDRVASLVGRVRPVDPQLIGLPQQVDQLGEAPLAVGRAAVERGTRRLGVQLVRDRAQLRQDRAPGRLGRVRGEHRPDRQPSCGRGHVVGRNPALGDQLSRAVQPAAVPGAAAAQLARAVRLLGDVRQVEVRGERAGQLRTGGHVHRRERGGSGFGVRPDLCPDLFDQVEQALTLLPYERLAQKGAKAPDVRAQRSVGFDCVD